MGAITIQVLATICACRGSNEGFKNAFRLQGVTTLVGLGLVIWGWVEYSKTSEGKCVGGDGINPRTLALVFLIMGSIGVPCAVGVAIQQMKNPTAGAATGGPEP